MFLKLGRLIPLYNSASKYHTDITIPRQFSRVCHVCIWIKRVCRGC